MLRALIVLALVLPGFAGCIDGRGNDDEADDGSAADAPSDAGPLSFSEPMLIDDVRAGGEPVIAVTRGGVLLISSHPGWTHYHPASDPTDPPSEILVPASAQSYLWRSPDGGATWEHVGAPMAMGTGPRGLAPGVSDPDFTITESNVAFHTDLEGLAMASVSWSEDDGATWIEGNPIASGGPVDRQWLASYGDTVYFTANYFGDHRILATTDGGVTWERLGDVPCSGDIVASPDGTLYAGCGATIAVSTDGGTAWDTHTVPDHDSSDTRNFAEPVTDSGGNVWTTWIEGDEQQLWLAGSPDKGETWPWAYEMSAEVRDLFSADVAVLVWPWVSAGSEGRVAVTAYATPTEGSSDGGDPGRLWYVVTVAVLDADTDHPWMFADDLAQNYVGPICQSGTVCQIGSMAGDDASDRRLGDFFETTIDADGYLHVAYADAATLPDDVVSHVGYVRQVGGPRFVVDGYYPSQG